LIEESLNDTSALVKSIIKKLKNNGYDNTDIINHLNSLKGIIDGHKAMLIKESVIREMNTHQCENILAENEHDNIIIQSVCGKVIIKVIINNNNPDVMEILVKLLNNEPGLLKFIQENMVQKDEGWCYYSTLFEYGLLFLDSLLNIAH